MAQVCRSRTDGDGPLRTGKKGPARRGHAADSDSDSCGNESRPISCSSRARAVALGKAPAGARHRARAAATRRGASRSWGGHGRPLRRYASTLRLGRGAEVGRARPNAHQPRRATRWHERASKTKRPRGPAEAPGQGAKPDRVRCPSLLQVRVVLSRSAEVPGPPAAPAGRFKLKARHWQGGLGLAEGPQQPVRAGPGEHDYAGDSDVFKLAP
jgi:hypothetical protein